MAVEPPVPCDAEREVRVLFDVGGRGDDADLAPVGVDLIGEDRSDARVGALAELDVLADHGDGAVGRDAQEGVGRERATLSAAAARVARGQMEADDEADGGRALQELAAIGGYGGVHGSALQAARGVVDGGANAVIGAAAADVAVHGEVDVAVRRLRHLGEEGDRRHDLARLAVAALGNLERDPGRLAPHRSTLPCAPSMVVTSEPSSVPIGVTQARRGWLSTWTVQAPHCATPQPNLVPVRPSHVAQEPQERHRRVAVELHRLPVHFSEIIGCLTLLQAGTHEVASREGSLARDGTLSWLPWVPEARSYYSAGCGADGRGRRLRAARPAIQRLMT